MTSNHQEPEEQEEGVDQNQSGAFKDTTGAVEPHPGGATYASRSKEESCSLEKSDSMCRRDSASSAPTAAPVPAPFSPCAAPPASAPGPSVSSSFLFLSDSMTDCDRCAGSLGRRWLAPSPGNRSVFSLRNQGTKQPGSLFSLSRSVAES